MIRVLIAKSYDRSFDPLAPVEKIHVRRSVKKLLDYFDGGQKPLGIGLRKLRFDYWEIRAGLDLRVLFMLQGDRVIFVLIGDHDDVRRAVGR